MRKILSLLFFCILFYSCSDTTVRTSDYYEDTTVIEDIVQSADRTLHSDISESNSKDYLVLFYMDADNYDNDDIYLQLVSIAKGLSLIRNSDGSAKDEFKNVTAVVMWDGLNKDNSYTPKYYHPYSQVLEIKTPTSTKTADLLNNLNSFAIDYSSDILKSDNNWLGSSQEVNMANKDTLSNFLSWALAKYNSNNDKNVILAFCGGGGGSFGEEVDSYIYKYDSRATSCDYSSNKYYLPAIHIVEALKTNGINSLNKLKMLIVDSKCSSSLEDAYEYFHYTDTLLVSPSSVPGGAIDFSYFFKSFTKDYSVFDIGTRAVNIYANQHYKDKDYKNDIQPASLTFMNLKYIDALVADVSSLANEILNTKDQAEPRIDGSYTIYECMANEEYGFLRYKDYVTNSVLPYSMFYETEYNHAIPQNDEFFGYFYQHDIAYMAYSIGTVCQKYGENSIYYYCDGIIKDLKNIIIASWRNGTDTKEGLYPTLEPAEEESKSLSVTYDSNVYGITITGQARINFNGEGGGEYLQPYNFSNFSFKNDYPAWGNMLYDIFPEEFKENTYHYYK